VVAHDLRGALTPVRGFADLLIRFSKTEQVPESWQRALETISANSRRMERMIEDLLDVSRIEARRLALIKRSVNLPMLVRGIIERSRELTKDHPVKLVLGEGPFRQTEVDPDRIEQILVNILSNAAKYSYPESDITVTIEQRPHEILISVFNLGVGIATEDREQLFTRFHRTSQAQEENIPGLGLGLYIAKGLVEAHGGRIWVESEPGKYATFRFTLPVSPPA
jgi:signal transduction histidine kinase